MISRFLPLFLAIVAFAVTLAVENWPSTHPGEPAHAATTRQSTLRRSSQGSPAATRPLMSALLDSPAAQFPQKGAGGTDPQPGESETVSGSDPDEAGPALDAQQAPALIQLVPPTAESPQQTVTFQNLGSKHLTFSVSTVDSTGAVHSSIQISSPPHKRVVLNERGLIVLPGDQIVVKSPPYMDFSVSAD